MNFGKKFLNSHTSTKIYIVKKIQRNFILPGYVLVVTIELLQFNGCDYKLRKTAKTVQYANMKYSTSTDISKRK